MTAQLITRTRENYFANLALAKAQPEETFEIVRDNWKNLIDVESKQNLLDAMVHSDNPHLLEILYAGANDNAAVQAKAYELLQGFAYRNFRSDPAAYSTWQTKEYSAGKPVRKSSRPVAPPLWRNTSMPVARRSFRCSTC